MSIANSAYALWTKPNERASLTCLDYIESTSSTKNLIYLDKVSVKKRNQSRAYEHQDSPYALPVKSKNLTRWTFPRPCPAPTFQLNSTKPLRAHNTCEWPLEIIAFQECLPAFSSPMRQIYLTGGCYRELKECISYLLAENCKNWEIVSK